ncbi:MAG: ATP--guanido phosphotransferase [Planctomycetota bacterium]
MSTVEELWQQIPPIAAPVDPVVVSARVRLARNLADLPFRRSMGGDQQEAVVDAIARTCRKHLPPDSYHHCDLSRTDHRVAQALVERHLISPALAASSPRPTGCVVARDETSSVMINEEDHLRLQVLLPGRALHEALERAVDLDRRLEQDLDWSVHERFGYLTSCPTNTGTGMRASVMVHLPGLSRTRELRTAFRGLGKLHMTVRGLYGEGTEAVGNYYQISNQRTLGTSEDAIIEQLHEVVTVVVEHEHMARAALLEQRRDELEDLVHRSLGVLRHARLLTTNEVCEHCNWLRLGMSTGVLEETHLQELLALEIRSKAAHLRLTEPDADDPDQRKQLRARLFRNWLASWN